MSVESILDGNFEAYFSDDEDAFWEYFHGEIGYEDYNFAEDSEKFSVSKQWIKSMLVAAAKKGVEMALGQVEDNTYRTEQCRKDAERYRMELQKHRSEILKGELGRLMAECDMNIRSADRRVKEIETPSG